MDMQTDQPRNGEFFPGIFDSDGRPWNMWQEQIAKPRNTAVELYGRAQLDALKIALLTQHEVVLPIGYLFDNPFLQTIFLRYSQHGEESDAFRMLMRDVVRIAHGSSVGNNVVDHWDERFRDWAIGITTKRNQLVYMNALSHEAASALQRERKNHIQKVESEMRKIWKIDYPMFLDLCEKIKFRSIGEQPFKFDELVRSHLLGKDGKKEYFKNFTSEISDKVQAIAEAASRAGQRLSRSLMNNPDRCLELGAVSLDRTQYEDVADIFVHYHHLAFAESFSLDGVSTRTIPSLSAQAQQRLKGEIDRVIEDLAIRGQVSAFPLEKMRFIDILRVRGGDNYITFDRNLRRIHAAALAENHDDYIKAIKEHAKYVAYILTWPFGQIALNELLKTAPKIIFAGEEENRLFEYVRAAALRLPNLASPFRGVKSGFIGWQYLRSLSSIDRIAGDLAPPKIE